MKKKKWIYAYYRDYKHVKSKTTHRGEMRMWIQIRIGLQFFYRCVVWNYRSLCKMRKHKIYWMEINKNWTFSLYHVLHPVPLTLLVSYGGREARRRRILIIISTHVNIIKWDDSQSSQLKQLNCSHTLYSVIINQIKLITDYL